MRLALALTLAACVVSSASQAGAQERPTAPSPSLTPAANALSQAAIPKFELAAGYASIQDLTLGESFPGGWFVSFERNAKPWLGIAVEWSLTRASTSHTELLPGIVDPRTGALMSTGYSLDTSLRTGALLIGPTLSYHHHRLVPFGRLLAGGVGMGGSSTIQLPHAPNGPGDRIGGDSEGSVEAALQPGIGMDLQVSRRAGLRVTADYRWLIGVGTASALTASELWLKAGLLFTFGTR